MSTSFKVNDSSSSASPYHSNSPYQELLLPADAGSTDADEAGGLHSRSTSSASAHLSFHAHDLVAYEDLPDWSKDNEYVRAGYRQVDRLSTTQCLSSVFRLHNETINIWSHLLGAAAFVALTAWCARQVSLQAGATVLDCCAFIPFFIGVVGCLALSTSYHTMSCKNERAAACWVLADCTLTC